MAMTTAAEAALGFQSSREEVSIAELPLSGALPDWLAGSLLRTGPALFEVGEQSLAHWFDGLAMLHRFTIGDGRVSYGSRFLHGRSWRAAHERGRIAYGEFATDPCRSLFARVQSMFTGPQLTDNGNVNVAALGERFVAMTETPIPVQFDARTLEAADVAPYVAPGVLSTAHPHGDRRDRALLNYAAALGPRSHYRFYRVDPATASVRTLAQIPVHEPAYMHSFGLTERFFVLAEFPLVVSPIRLALSGRPFIENYRFRPELGTRFSLVDRSSGAVAGRWRAEPCFAFHHINSFERDGEVVVDVCAYPDATIVEDLYLDRLRSGAGVHSGNPTRFVLAPGADETTGEPLSGDGTGLELPRINYGRCNERPYRWVWGNAVGPSGWLERIVALDTERGIAHTWSDDGCFPGEPVFVARPGAEAEDDGVLLSVVLDAARGRSMLVVLDAATLAELARAQVPHHIPFGFHGQFAR